MKENILKLKKSKVTRNSIWIISEKIIQMIISLVITSLSARYLGPSNYGMISYGASLVTLFLSIVRLGLDSILVKEFIENREDNGKIVGSALLMRIFSSFLSIIMIVILSMILQPHNKLLQLLTFLQSLALIFQSYEIIDYWFQSNLDSKYPSIAKMIAYIVVSLYKAYLLITAKSVKWFALSNSIDYFIILIILLYLYKRNGGKKLSFSNYYSKKMLKSSYHFIISGLMVTLYTQMDKIMIGNMINEFQVGLYSAATSICTLWGFLPDAIISSFRPIVYKYKKENNPYYLKRLKLLYCIIFWLGISFGLLILLFSKWIILILYGSEYLSCRSALFIAVWYTTFAFLGSARGIWIVSENKNKYTKRYIFIGALVNLILNTLLIPKFGINGAALATLVSQITVALIAPLLFKETRISTKYMLDGIFFKEVK